MALPTLSGTARLTADPELRFSASGTAVCKVNMAFNDRKKDESTGQWVDSDVLFVTGTLFKQAAENAAESLTKGTEVVVTGRLKTRQWEKDGEKRSTVELMINSIGPALNWVQVKVQKMDRASQSGANFAGDDPWATASTTRPANADTSRTSSFDEEPPF